MRKKNPLLITIDQYQGDTQEIFYLSNDSDDENISSKPLVENVEEASLLKLCTIECMCAFK